MAVLNRKGSKNSGRISSNSREAKKIIRNEMLSFFPAREYGTRTRFDAMRKDANAYNGGEGPKRGVSNYKKGAALVDAASLAVYDQDRMLGKIYGKKNVANWDMQKRHETYKHLVGREYAAMCEEIARSGKPRKF